MKTSRILLLAVAVAAIAAAATYYIIQITNYSASESDDVYRVEVSPADSASEPKVVLPSHGARSDSFPTDERQPMPDGWK